MGYFGDILPVKLLSGDSCHISHLDLHSGSVMGDRDLTESRTNCCDLRFTCVHCLQHRVDILLDLYCCHHGESEQRI